MLSSQVSRCPKIFLNRQHETIHRSYISLIELVILFEDEVLILEDDILLLLLTFENRVDPVAVIHVHRVDEEGLHYIVVDLSCLANDFLLLPGILGYQLLTGGIDHLT